MFQDLFTTADKDHDERDKRELMEAAKAAGPSVEAAVREYVRGLEEGQYVAHVDLADDLEVLTRSTAAYLATKTVMTLAAREVPPQTVFCFIVEPSPDDRSRFGIIQIVTDADGPDLVNLPFGTVTMHAYDKPCRLRGVLFTALVLEPVKGDDDNPLLSILGLQELRGHLDVVYSYRGDDGELRFGLRRHALEIPAVPDGFELASGIYTGEHVKVGPVETLGADEVPWHAKAIMDSLYRLNEAVLPRHAEFNKFAMLKKYAPENAQE